MIKLNELPSNNWEDISFEKVSSTNRIQIRKLFESLVKMTSIGELCEDQGIRVLQVENLIEQVFDGNGVLELDKILPVVVLGSEQKSPVFEFSDVPTISFISTQLEPNIKRCISDKRAIVVKDIMTNSQLLSVLRIVERNSDLEDFGDFTLYCVVGDEIGKCGFSFVYDKRKENESRTNELRNKAENEEVPIENQQIPNEISTKTILETLINDPKLNEIETKQIMVNDGTIEYIIKNEINERDTFINLPFLQLQLYKKPSSENQG
jgi:hypothetical protein